MRYELEVEIERAAEDVFAFLTELANLPRWQETVEEAVAEADGPLGPGARFREVRTFAGRRVESRVEVTEHEPPSRFSIRVVEGPVPFAVAHSLVDAGGRTRLHVTGEGEPGRLFRIAGPMLARAAKRQAEGDFRRLKELLEAEA